MNYKIDIIIIEDNDSLREGYKFLLDNESNFNVVETFIDGESALKKLQKLNPDVVLIDLELPGIDGIETIERGKKLLPKTHFLVLTVHEDDVHVFKALMKGASGYITKNSTYKDIVSSIQEVLQGGAPMSSKIAKMVVGSFRAEKDFLLTKREVEVLELLAKGNTYDQIAEKLFVSQETIKSHLKHTYSKLNVSNKADAVFKAMKNNIIN